MRIASTLRSSRSGATSSPPARGRRRARGERFRPLEGRQRQRRVDRRSGVARVPSRPACPARAARVRRPRLQHHSACGRGSLHTAPARRARRHCFIRSPRHPITAPCATRRSRRRPTDDGEVRLERRTVFAATSNARFASVRRAGMPPHEGGRPMPAGPAKPGAGVTVSRPAAPRRDGPPPPGPPTRSAPACAAGLGWHPLRGPPAPRAPLWRAAWPIPRYAPDRRWGR